ncbi:retrovirus-related pol polyprotein from transposon TNT 1-94 [Tanacetum coccineum]
MIWMNMTDYDELNTAKVALMVNLSHYGLDALVESNVVNYSETKITSDSNIIPYSQTQVVNCTKINLDNKSVNNTLAAELERYKEQVKVLKEGQNVDLKSKDNVSDSCEQSVEIDRLKQTLLKYKAQQLEPKLYDGNVIKNTSAIVIPGSEETLVLAEESHPNPSERPTKVVVLKELPKVSMVNTSLKKLKHHLVGFDVVVKERTTATAITEGSWGFDHTKACFRDEIIPFVKALNDLFNTFDQYLIDELFEVQNVFHQIEQAVEQHRLESKTFNVKMNQVLNENEQLLEQVINKDIMNIIMNYSVDNAYVNVHECEKCLKLETGLLNKKDFIEKETYDKLFRSFTTLEKHCISLEVDTQLNQEIFQRENSVSNQGAPSFDQYFDLNELKAQSQEKDTEKEVVITALKNELRKLKRKDLADNVVTKHPISPGMLKIDVEPIAPKLLNNRTAHSNYLRHTQEQAAILREIVEQGKSQNPLNNYVDSACKYTKHIQELLIIIRQTCPSINNSSDKLVVVTPKNKYKRVRFMEPVTSSGNKITKTSSSSNLVSNKPALSSTGVRSSTSASGSQPSANTTKDKIQRTPSSTQKNKVEAHPRTIKSSLKNKNFFVEPKINANVQHSKINANSELLCVKCNGCMLSDNHDLCVLDFINDVNARNKSKSIFTIVGNACPLTRITTTAEVPLRKPTTLESDTPKPMVIQIVLWYLDSSCSEHMTGDRSQLTNFINKFLGTVKFRNDHVAKILGYGDYQIGNVTILRVYYVEGLGYNLFSIRKFCDSNLEVAFRQHTCFIRNLEGVDLLTGSRGNNMYTLSLGDMMASSPICLLSKALKTKIDNGTEFVNQTLREYYEKVGISHETYVARSPQQNGVVERQAVATTCHTQNRSIIRLRHDKTPYELFHDKLLDLSFFYVFRALCYPKNDSENLGKLQPKVDIDFDELTVMASKHSSLGPALHEMTPATISSGLVPNPPPSTPFALPLRIDWDILFQPLFDELLNPPSSVDRPAPEVIALIAKVVAPEPAASTGSPSSTTIDQDASSPKNDFEASFSSDVIPTIMHTAAPNSENLTKWTKDHPLGNIIGVLKRLVSTRLQLHEQALFCYYDAFLTSVEPKNYKDALTQACWIEAMQEVLNEFERLEVWELVPHPNKVRVITLKWIYMVKLDELGGILKNKARLVAHGYRQ